MRNPTKTQRNENIRILAGRHYPTPVKRIAEIFGISRQRVYAILKKASK